MKKMTSSTRILHKQWQKLVCVLACLVVFVTTYALILPAITLEAEQTLACSYENHRHDESCWNEDEDLICGYADYVVHTHDAETCYDADGNLVCPLGEVEVHEHSESCYETQNVLTCEAQEYNLHTHSED